MRSEEQIRELYKKYVRSHAICSLNNMDRAADQSWGAAMALGLTLGKDMKRIKRDIETVKEYMRRQDQD